MNARDDLFGELLPAIYNDDDEARALAWGLVSDWFGTLRYAHSADAHSEILDSLTWPGMSDFVREASLHIQDAHIVDYEDFAAGIRHQARLAEREGRVVAAGKPRPRGGAGDASGDLFAGDGGRGAK